MRSIGGGGEESQQGGVSRLLQGSYKLRLLQVGVVDEGSTWAEYTNKITKEICLSAKCPECSRKMIVSKDSAVGINEDSEKYTKTIARGI